MNAWAKHHKIDKVKVIPDGNGEFTRKMGMLVEKVTLVLVTDLGDMQLLLMIVKFWKHLLRKGLKITVKMTHMRCLHLKNTKYLEVNSKDSCVVLS